MEAGERIILSNKEWAGRRPVYWFVVFVFALVAVAAMQKQMKVMFLHAESAQYLMVAKGLPAQDQRNFVQELLTTGSHGHYTPLAFTSEFLFAKWAGLRPEWWRNRQLFAGGLIAFFLFGLLRTAMAMAGAHASARNLFAAGGTFLFIANPLMRDLLLWPFHIFYIGWIVCALALAQSIIHLFVSTHSKRMIWLIALLAYGSMHLLGLGVACAAGTLALFLIILGGLQLGAFPELASQRNTLLLATILLALAASIHAGAMIFLNNADIRASVAHHYDWQKTLGLLVVAPLSILSVLFGVRLEDFGIDGVLRSAAAFGAAFLLAATVFTVALLRKSGRTRRENAAAALAIFSTVLLIVIVTMIGLREMQEPTATGFYLYFVGARYVAPMAVPWLGLILAGLLLLPMGRARLLALAAILFGIAAVVAHFRYEKKVRPFLQPLHGVSNMEVWRDLTQVATEARAANLPIPNLPLRPMTGFSFMDLKYFEPLLRQWLHLPETARDDFIPWSECRDHRLAEYIAECPTLPVTARLLDLDLHPNDSSQSLEDGVEVKSAQPGK